MVNSLFNTMKLCLSALVRCIRGFWTSGSDVIEWVYLAVNPMPQGHIVLTYHLKYGVFCSVELIRDKTTRWHNVIGTGQLEHFEQGQAK